MTAPITIAGATFASPAELLAGVARDLDRGGGTVVKGQRPAEWLAAAVESGELSIELARGLAAALISRGVPAQAVEAARLARRLKIGDLSPLLHAALDGLDLGVLLRRAKPGHDASVEDELLACWARVEPGGDPERVVALLRRLREVGLRTLEIEVLGRLGTPELVREIMPSLIEEPLSVAEAASLAPLLHGDDKTREALLPFVDQLDAEARSALLPGR
ncbi:MAG: hypothetical protein EA397_18975 [Deltaproteobacteria bacterium]|nr:MAG: hypothetical protein EA397_18975 [Deltaproteobacteria bacterium]